jgi:hypothetical protein
MVDWDSASDHSSFGVVHASLVVRKRKGPVYYRAFSIQVEC